MISDLDETCAACCVLHNTRAQRSCEMGERRREEEEERGGGERASGGTHLSLEHQLSGEQHGLVAEGVSSLHAPGCVPGAPRTVDAWPSGEKEEAGSGLLFDSRTQGSWV